MREWNSSYRRDRQHLYCFFHRAGFIAPLPMPQRVHSAVCQQRITTFGAFKCSLRNRQQIPNWFIAPLLQLYLVDKRPLTDRSFGNLFPNSQQLYEMALFSKHLCASLFNVNLSNEPNVGRIHLAGPVDSTFKKSGEDIKLFFSPLCLYGR